MKRILNLPTLFLAAMATMFLVSCSDEPGTGTGTNVRPVVTLTSESDITVNPEEAFTIDFSASKGDDSPLESVTVYEDGTKVPFSRMKYNGEDAASNPALLFNDDVDGLTWSIEVVAHSTAASTVAYEVEVEDEAEQKSSVIVNVTTSGTPPKLTTTSPTTGTTFQDFKNKFELTAEKGSGDLVSIEVRENNQLVDKSDIFWKEISMSVGENPFFLAEEDQGGFDKQELFIMTPAAIGTFTYKILLTDEFGLTAQLEFELTTIPNGTAIDSIFGVLLNSAGPDGTGGLDLDNGMGTGSMDSEAEIRDNGIDDNLPDEDNWIRTISPVNNATMKYLIAGQGGLPEGFTFAGIQFKEDIPDLFNNGVDFSASASDVVQLDDVFIVERDGRYWVLEVVEISTDPNNNEDFYEFDIKY